MEKDHDPWWPIASAIDDFNDIRKNNVESSWIKVLDESMSAWRPRTSKNGGLPNISYIIRKPEPLGTEFKTVCCPVTGVMTYMEIQRGKSGMSTQPYHKDLGATAACTIRAGEATNVHQEARTILMGDAWFGSVKAASVASKRKMEAVYQIKSNHGLYPKQFIEDALKDGPGGTHIVLEGKHPDGAELIAIGYRYNSKVTLCFVMTKNAGSTKPGTPYEMKFTDLHGNVHVRLVDRPAVISNFFQASNCVDKHNQARQYELALEKKWDTRDPWFRITTTLIGVNVVDAWKLSLHHTLFSRLQLKHNAESTVSINVFAGILTKQLLRKANNVMKSMAASTMGIRCILGEQEQDISDMSASLQPSLDKKNKEPRICYYPKITNAKGKTYKKSRRCVECNNLSVTYCGCCDKTYCHAVGPKNHGRTCLVDHIEKMKQNGRKRSRVRDHFALINYTKYSYYDF